MFLILYINVNILYKYIKTGNHGNRLTSVLLAISYWHTQTHTHTLHCEQEAVVWVSTSGVQCASCDATHIDDLGDSETRWEGQDKQSGIGRHTHRWKQSHPVVQEAPSARILQKCQAKHTSVEVRGPCQGALMQHAWCFSNEDTLRQRERCRDSNKYQERVDNQPEN